MARVSHNWPAAICSREKPPANRDRIHPVVIRRGLISACVMNGSFQRKDFFSYSEPLKLGFDRPESLQDLLFLARAAPSGT